MPQIFHPSMNTFSRVSLFGVIFVLASAVGLAAFYVRSPYATEAGVIRSQPVPFSHQHHVGEVGIDCRYCHRTVETQATAGMPTTEVCMGCHSELWAESPMLEPVRQSWRDRKPLKWTRVNNLPDFAYFHHGIHISKGISCKTCHGNVDRMPLMWRDQTLLMEWCLDCHRDSQKHVQPREAIFDFDHIVPEHDRKEFAEAHGVESKTNCSICHR